MTKDFYPYPKQVCFLDKQGLKLGGIAYQEEVICGDCGQALSLSDVEIIKEYNWISLSDEIIGDDELNYMYMQERELK